MNASNNKLLKALKKKISNENSVISELVAEFNLNNEEDKYLQLLFDEIEKKYYSKKYINGYIDNVNNTLLKYAKNDYSRHLKFVGNGYLDSLITCIDFLGEELNYSTVTTHYLQDVFNSVGDMLFVVDNMGYILFINKASCEILKYKENEIKRKNINIILDKEVSFSAITDNKVKGKIFSFYSKSNQIIPVSINISDFSRKDNPFMGYVLIARDMSVAIKYQKEIEKTNLELKVALEKAEESDRLKTAFLQNMSHEIRTPLNGIVGFSQLLINKNLPETKKQEIAQLVEKSSQRLIELVNNVLDIAKIETGQVKINSSAFMLNNFMGEIYDFFKLFVKEKNIKLTLSNYLIDDDSIIFLDKEKLHQILLNLINNAIKFTNQGEINFGYLIKGKEIEFFVQDTGPGISEEMQSKIFDRFMQADTKLTRNYEGAGLGLSICKGLVELLGGKIWVRSKPGKEAIFFFTVPFNPVNKNYEYIKSTYMDIEQINKVLKILVAEDDEINFKFLDYLFSQTKHKLSRACNGQEAVDLFINQDDFDIVLMDLKMPVMSGYEATTILKKKFPQVPIIAYTAYAFEEDKQKAFNAGCDDIIQKPFRNEDLFEKIIKLVS